MEEFCAFTITIRTVLCSRDRPASFTYQQPLVVGTDIINFFHLLWGKWAFKTECLFVCLQTCEMLVFIVLCHSCGWLPDAP